MHAWYICAQCGGLRHAPAPRAAGPVRAPRHCRTPMHLLTAERAAAARRTSRKLRRTWVQHGMQVLATRSGRRATYHPAIWPRQLAEAARQRAVEEQARQQQLQQLDEQLRRSPLYLLEHKLPLALALVAGGYADAQLTDGQLILTCRNR